MPDSIPGQRLPERFWASISIDPVSGCWEWTGTRDASNYGSFSWKAKTFRAHRAVYTELVGPIPEGLVIDHLCRNRPCVNPDHLEVVTSAENTRRGTSFAVVNAAKTHCLRGHEFTPATTYTRREPSGATKRVCLPCLAWHSRNRRARLTAERRAARALVAALGVDPQKETQQ